MKHRIRRLGRALYHLPSNLALIIVNTEPLSRIFTARYHRAREQYLPHIPTLSGIDRTIVDMLQRDGICVTSLDALGLPESYAMLQAAQTLSEGYGEYARHQILGGTNFTIVSPSALVSRPEIFAWGLEERLLNIIEAYLGLPVAYDGPHIIYTVADGRQVSTRRWHRDREDRSMIKIAVYCNDVDSDGGPFQIVRASGERKDDIDGYRYFEMSDEDLPLFNGGRQDWDVVTCEGKAGTVIFADTARNFHRGKPASTQDRKAVFYSYFSRRPRHPFFCERSGLSRKQIALLAKPLPQRQQASALWRRTLPALIRLIPTARF